MRPIRIDDAAVHAQAQELRAQHSDALLALESSEPETDRCYDAGMIAAVLLTRAAQGDDAAAEQLATLPPPPAPPQS